MAGKVAVQLGEGVLDVFVRNNFFFHYATVQYDRVLSQARMILSGSGWSFCTVLVIFKKRYLNEVSFEITPVFS